MDAAYWEGGWFGIEAPMAQKFHRSGLLIVDETGFQVSNKMVDHDTFTLSVPDTIAARVVTTARIGINRKTKLMNYKIVFPTADIDCNVLQLSHSYFPRSIR
jgi:hypothetical protein